MLPCPFSNDRKRWKSDGARSGLYGGCINTSQPSSLNFCCVAIGKCGVALPWWNTTPFLFTSSGRLFFNILLTSSAADSRGQNRQFYPVAKAHSGRFLSNSTIPKASLCFESGGTLPRSVGLVHASTIIFSAYSYRKSPIFFTCN